MDLAGGLRRTESAETKIGTDGNRKRALRMGVSMRGRFTAAVLLGALVFAGSGVVPAGASPNHGLTHITAAQDQYGGHHVAPPAPSHVFTPPKTTAPKTTAPKTSAPKTPAATNTLAAPNTSAAPVATTAGTLPFTGLALLKVVLVGLGLLALGFALHRWSRSRPRA
jgi:hypothetical protein